MDYKTLPAGKGECISEELSYGRGSVVGRRSFRWNRRRLEAHRP